MACRNCVWVILLAIIAVAILAGPLMIMGIWGPMGGMSGPRMMGPGMMDGRRYGYGYGFNWVGTILMILFIALIGLGIYYLLGGGKTASRDRYLEILKERYAKGEITSEEYARMKQELSKED